MAVGSNGLASGVVVTTHDGGATWLSATTPTGAIAMSSVVCTGPNAALASTVCTALVSSGTVTWSSRTTDFGHTWTQMGNLPASFVAAGKLDCDGAGSCLVPGYVPTTAGHGAGAIALSPDGGQTWTGASVPSGTGVLQSATCLNGTLCLAAGSTSTTVSDVVPAHGTVLRSADGGHTWVTVSGAVPVDDVYGLDCPTRRVCAMVGTEWSGTPELGSGAVGHSVDGGTTFTAAPTAYVPITLTAIACPSVATCLAVGGDTIARVALPAAQSKRPSQALNPLRG
jgi:photosystem II stability/assembly factor-like uncharacterized protein